MTLSGKAPRPEGLAETTARSRHSRGAAAPLWLIGVAYASLLLVPLGLAWRHHPIEPRAPVDTLASALGIVAFAALQVDFLFSGRTRWISDRIGVRRTMSIHRWVVYAIIPCIVIHPFLYSAPEGVSWPWFNAADPMLPIGVWSLVTGLAAWILTAGIILVAVDHKKMPGSYRSWRLMHAASAFVLGALIAVHAITSGGYSSRMFLAGYWILLLSAGLLILLEMFLFQPWRRRRSFRVARDVSKRTADPETGSVE